MEPAFEPHGQIINADRMDNGEGPFYELQKRDCVHFIIPLELFPHDALHVFWLSLTRHPAIVTRVVCIRHGESTAGSTNSPDIEVYENFGTEPYTIVRGRVASTMDRLKSADYETYACVPPAPTVMDHCKWNFYAVSRTLPLEYWVATKEWNGMLRVGVLVEDLAVAAGLKRIWSVVAMGSAASAA